MTHTVHVLTNAQNEAYIMLLKEKKALETVVNQVEQGNAHFQKKNRNRCRFVIEANGSLQIEHHAVPAQFTHITEVWAYRDSVIEQYAADCYLVVDEKYSEILDAPAAKNFGEVLARMDMKAAVAKHGQETLVAARKTMTVGEFVENFS